MKKETLLTIAVIALLLLNFGILGFLLFQRPPHPPGAGSMPLDRRIEEQLHLNAEQQQQFERLKSAHHEQMQASDRAYRDAMSHYFALLKSDTIVAGRRDSLLAELTYIQQERVTATFQHFSDLKALCTPEQRENFDALVPAFLQVILPPPPVRGRRRE